jgi:HTH-type transcriptional regulator / antitoxin HigA
MTTEERLPWTPEWALPPGEVLAEALEELGMSQAELARRTARPMKTISEIVTGKATITNETALQLELVLGVPASLWLGLEARYRESLARRRASEQFQGYVDWSRRFPLPDLIRHGLIPDGSDVERARSMLEYFRVSSPSGWEQHWGRLSASYRLSRTASVSPHALTAWLRWGEIEAGSLTTGRFSATRLGEVLVEAKPLSREVIFESARRSLVALFGSAGVSLVVLPTLQGAPASGAVVWLSGSRPAILISMRFLTDDQFWFSLYHEAGHILTGRKGEDVVEEVAPTVIGTDEDRANAIARERLVPAEALDQFLARKTLTSSAVREFARALGVAPGLVVGRLQHDGHVPHRSMNQLKRRYEGVR